jgi:uncharacterized integral membrane protein
MIGSLLKDCKILKIEDSVAAGQAATVSDVVDTAGYEGACFIYKLGAVTDAAAVTLAIAQDTAANAATAHAIAGATAAIAVAATDSEQTLVVDVIKPRERYLQATLTIATQNAEIDSGFCILYNPNVMPVTQPATIDASAMVVSPAET